MIRPHRVVALAVSLLCSSSVVAREWRCECHEARLGWLQRHGFGVAAPGAERLRFHSATGRDLRNFPPDRLVDFASMTLKLDIPDMNTPRLTGVSRLTFTPIGKALGTLRLNAEQMTIAADAVNLVEGGAGAKVTATYDDRVLSVSFSPELEVGKPVTLEVRYALNDPPEGLFWTPESPEWKGRPAQIHTQGQPETNRWWFPSHDFPNERLSTRLEITVPEGYQAVANGALKGTNTKDGRSTFVWEQAGDHVNYLVMMAVGKWDIVDVATLDGAQHRVPMPVYAPLGRGADVARTYGRTADMMEVFERRFGVPYPWEKYAQVIVWNFGAGGMENTSATTMYDTAILDDKSLRDGDLDGLISHELAHQWFGDLITCNTWAHIWLNEGWATYSTALWYEARDGFDGGPAALQNGYLMSMHGSMRGVAAADQIAPGASAEDRARPGMVSNVYEHPWEVFRRTSNPYPKGASVLHMLRMKLGEEVFFAGVRAYVKRYQHQTAETDQFRRVLEEVSGVSLERFFEQWTLRPGTPRLHVKAEWDAQASELAIVVEQRQHIDAELPAFVFDLPVVVRVKGQRSDVTIPVDGRRHERRMKLDAEPEMVVVDPMLTVLADLTVEQPTRRFITQLNEGPTAPSRVDAARALSRNTGSAEAVQALAGAVRNSQENAAVRAEAAMSLGKLGRADAVLEAARAGEADSKMGAIENARVRLGIVRGLASANTAEALDALTRVAGTEDESYAVRAAAIEAVGKRGRAEDLQVIVAALGSESRDDTLRQTALRALADLNLKEALDAAIPLTRPGVLTRTRGVAAEVVGRLARHDTDKAYAALAPLVIDREARPRGAAAAALVEAKDKRGLDDLARAIASARDPVWRERLEEARAQLAAAANADKSVDGVNAELERLRRELELLKQKMKDEIEKK
ncbi:MAG: M1 family aminopeptidase [Phycisphaerales bacterium]